jgi:hypothetical protein
MDMGHSGHRELSEFIRKRNQTVKEHKKSMACSMGGTKYHKYCDKKKTCSCECHKVISETK